MKNELDLLLMALRFLTRLPLPQAANYTPERDVTARRYFPLAGAAIGLMMAVVYGAALLALPQGVSVLLAIAAGLMVTGALHEDGLADTFDSFGGSSREQSLEIMRDSRIGTFGTAALVMALAIKAAALVTLPAWAGASTLVAAHCLSRLSAVLARSSSRPARADGLAAERAAPLEGMDLAIAAGTGVAVFVLCAFWTPFFALIAGLAGLVLGHVAIRVMAERRLGGYTGDTLGGVQQMGELGFMLGVAAWL